MSSSAVSINVFENSILTVNFHSETIVEHTVAEVWSHAVNIKSWMNAYQSETVSGEPTHVGEVVKLTNLNAGDKTPEPHHHFYRVLNVIPMKQVAIKAFGAEGGSYGLKQNNSYDTISVYERGDSTLVSFDMIAELIPGEIMSDSELLEMGRAMSEGVGKNSEVFWDNLKLLVEKDS